MASQTFFFVSNAYPPNIIGGAEIVAHNQAKALKKRGNNVVVFAGETYSDKPLYHVYRDDFEGVCVYRIKLEANNFSASGINFFSKQVNAAFERLVKEYRPEVVHMHNMVGLSLGMIDVAKEYQSKVVITLHDHWGYCYKNTRLAPNGQPCKDVMHCERCKPFLDDGMHIPLKLRKDYFNYILGKVDAFISPSQYLADCYVEAGFPKEKIHVIWNGIDTQQYKSLRTTKSNRIRFTFVGYFGKHKGVINILEALSKSKYRNQMELNLVGAGEELANYQEFIRQKKLEQNVKFWGKLPNSMVKRVYESTDIYVIASIWPENQPVSITEAMICRKPVIASNLGGNIELIQDGISGFLFDAASVDDLMQKMEWFVDHPEKISEFGEQGRNIMVNNTFDHQSAVIEELYRQIQPQKPNRSDITIAFESSFIPEHAVKGLAAEKAVLLEWIRDMDAVDIAILQEHTELPLTEVETRLESGQVIICPEDRDDIVQILKSRNCGLYYQKESAAHEYLHYILWHHNLLAVLKRNAKCTPDSES